jgi:hypothetical protein
MEPTQVPEVTPQLTPEEKQALNTAQRLAVREAQFAVVTAKELVQTRQNELMKLIQDLSKAVGFLSTENVNFDLTTLEFKKV